MLIPQEIITAQSAVAAIIWLDVDELQGNKLWYKQIIFALQQADLHLHPSGSDVLGAWPLLTEVNAADLP